MPSGEFFQLVDDVGRDVVAAVDLHHLVQQLLRHDLAAAQIHQAFDNQGRCDDGSNQQQPDRPTCSLEYGEQNELLNRNNRMAQCILLGRVGKCLVEFSTFSVDNNVSKVRPSLLNH
jgi:hypothetical protein